MRSLRKNKIMSMIGPIFYLVNLLRMTKGIDGLYLAAVFVFGLIGLYKLIVRAETPPFRMAFCLILLMGGFGILNMLFIHNMNLKDVMVDILLTGIAVLMVLYQTDFYSGMLSFYLVGIFFAFHYIKGTDTNHILNSSTNYISVVLLLAVSLYYIGLERSKRGWTVFDLLPSFLCFLFSVWARGRGGILSCGILLALLLLVFIKRAAGKSAVNKCFIFFAAFFILLLCLATEENLAEQVLQMGKFGTRGLNNTARVNIWSDYIHKTGESPVCLLLGTPLLSVPQVVKFELNTHNSFMQMHAFYGIVPFTIVIVLLFYAARYFIKSGLYLHLSVMTALVVRGMTDKFIFGQYGMPVMMYFVLFPLVHRAREDRRGL